VTESPRRHSEKRNGPVPTGRVASFAADSGATITNDPQAKDCSNPPDRRLNDKRSVYASMISTLRTACRRDFCGFTESAAKTRSNENFAVLASNAVPSWKRTPCRR
jgi:hypothetical protein